MSLVTLADAKEFLQITVTDTVQDTFIQVLIDGVEDQVERWCGVKLQAGACVDVLPGGGYSLVPARLPIVSVSEVYDVVNDTVSDTDDYRYDADGVYRVGNDRWDEARGKWRVTYVGGYLTGVSGGVNDTLLPDGLYNTILLLLYRQWENRGSFSSLSVSGRAAGYQPLPESDVMNFLRAYRRHGT